MVSDRLRILAVEDSPSDFRLLTEYLRASPSMDFEVVQAQTVTEALRLVSAERFAVVLLDLHLPDSMGLEGLERILATGLPSPVIVLTGVDDEETGLAALSKNAQDYLVKRKIDSDALIRSIRYSIERDRAERAIRQLNAELEQRIAEQTAEIRAANELLEQRVIARTAEVQQANEELRASRKAALNLMEDALHSQEALRLSEERFRLALAHAPVSVAAQDCDLRFIWAFNQRTVQPMQIIGKTDADLFAPDEAAHLSTLKRHVIETGLQTGEQLWLTSGGQRVFLDLFLEPLRAPNGEIIGVGVATVDLTEMKLMEMQARAQAYRIAALADLSQKLGQVALDVQTLLDVVTRGVAETIDNVCFVSFLSEAGQWFYPQSAYVPNGLGNLADEFFPLASTVLDEKYSTPTVLFGQVSSCRELSIDQIRLAVPPQAMDKVNRFQGSRLLLTPLRVQGQRIGIVGMIQSESGHANFADEPSFLQDVAERAATALTNAQLFHEVERARAELEQRVEERTESERQQRLLAEILRDANRAFNQNALNLDQVTGALIDFLSQVVPYDKMQIMLLEENKRLRVCATSGCQNASNPLSDGTVINLDSSLVLRQLIETKTSRLIPDVRQETIECPCLAALPKTLNWLGVPLIASNQIIGVYTVHKTEPGFFTAEHVHLAETLASYAAVAIQNAQHHSQLEQAHAQLQNLSRQLLEAEENERRAVARELHDEIGQVLTAVKTNMEVIRLCDLQSLPQCVDESSVIIDRALEQVRSLSLDLRPSMLDEFGLVVALEWYLERQAQRARMQIHFTADPREIELSPTLATTCFRVVQSAVTNAVRHAHADQMEITLRQRVVNSDGASTQELELAIRDNGVGFDVAAALERSMRGESMGILGMQERVRLVQGRFEIQSQVGHGTQICVQLPLG